MVSVRDDQHEQKLASWELFLGETKINSGCTHESVEKEAYIQGSTGWYIWNFYVKINFKIQTCLFI